MKKVIDGEKMSHVIYHLNKDYLGKKVDELETINKTMTCQIHKRL